MNIVVVENYQQVSKRAANMVVEAISQKPNAVLGLPTGSTPIGMYENLVKMYRNREISFKNVTAFNLDEYVGIDQMNEQSYFHYMWKHFYSHVDIEPNHCFIPNGAACDLTAECAEYDQKMFEHDGIDLQIFGIGLNGHIGFNEPGEKLPVYTHVVELTEKTRAANAKNFSSIDEVPTRALTVGTGILALSKKILVLASGVDKANVIRRFIDPIITTHCPATLLHLHPSVTLIIDKEAASEIEPALQVQ